LSSILECILQGEQFPNEYGITAFRGQVMQASSEEQVHKDEFRIHGNTASRHKMSIMHHTLHVRLAEGGEKRFQLHGDVIWRPGSNVVCYQVSKNGSTRTLAVGNLDSGEITVSPRAWKLLPASSRFRTAVGAWLLYTVIFIGYVASVASVDAPSWPFWLIVPVMPVVFVFWSLAETAERGARIGDAVRPHFDGLRKSLIPA
jgi:fatty acid desaturase